MVTSSRPLPGAGSAPLALRQWRERTLGWFARIVALAALPSILLDISGAWRHGRLDWVAFELIAIGGLLGLAFARGAGFRLRAYGLLGVGLLYALLTTLGLGLVGAGRLHILLVIALGAMLLERREAVWVWVAATLTGTGALLAMGLGALPMPAAAAARVLDPNSMLVNAAVLLSFSIMLGSLVLSLIAQLTASLRAAEGAIAEREAVNSRLESLVEARTEELRRSQALLQGLLDNAPAAVYVKDLEGRYLLTNGYLAALRNLAPDALIGQRDLDLFGEQARPWRAHEQAVIEAGATVASESVVSHNDVPHTYYEIKFPLRSADGTIAAIGGIAADISSRKRVEETLARQLGLQAAVARCARTLLRAHVAPHQRDGFLAAVFEEFRTSAGLAHVGLYGFRRHDGELHYKSLFQLPDPTTVAATTPLAALRPGVAQQLLSGEPVAAPADQVFLPGTPNEAYWRRRNVGTIAAALVMADGNAWGFASFSSTGPFRQPDPEELVMLGALAEMVGAFLSRLETSAALERQRAYAQALASCSATLLAQVEGAEIQAEALIGALEHLLAAVGCQRAYIYETVAAGPAGFVAQLRAEACAPGVVSDHRTARLPEGLFPPALLAELRAGQAVGGPIESLLAAAPPYRDLLARAGVASVLMMPITLGGALWGLLGLSDSQAGRSWLPDDLQMLRTAAEMLVAFLQSRRLLESLRERDYFIGRITEASPDLIYVFDLRERRNVFANREIASHLGYSAEEAAALGPRLLETIMAPDDYARLPAFQARSRAAADNEVVELEYQARRRDGSTCWLLNREVVFARDETGAPTQVLGLARDITQAKAARLAFEQNAALLRTISDALPDGYLYQVVQRPDASYVGYTYLSGGIEQLLGISPEAAIADPSLVHDTILPEDRAQVDAADLESVRALSTFDVELRRRKANGQVGWFQIRSVPQVQPDGHILWNGVCLDISRRKASELALTQANQTLRRRIDELAALNQIAQALMSWSDLPAALKTVGTMLLPLFAAERIAIWLRDEGRESLTQIALIGGEAVTIGGPTLRLREAPLARAVLTTRRGSVLDGGRADPVVIAPLAGGLDALSSSALVQPLLVRGDSIGLLAVRAATGRPTFTPADVELAQTIAGLLSSAIENGRLLQRTMAEAAQEERRRLARELHDSITQSLYSLSLLARAWSRLAPEAAPDELTGWFAQIEGIALQSLKEMRLLIYQLRSPELDVQGLAEALRHRLESVEGRSGVKVQLDAEAYRRPVAPAVEPQLYAIAQEALNNALRHASATRITVLLRSDQEGVLVEVTDDGHGFDPAAPSAGLGLTTMRERAEAIGGRLCIVSSPGQGAAVRAELPPSAATSRALPGLTSPRKRRTR